MIISVSGLTCTGTTSVGSKLAEKLGFEFYSMGQYYKEYQHDLPKMMVDFNTVDMKIEKYIEDIVNNNNNVVMEGRTVGISIYTDFSILLHADIETTIKRYMQRERIENVDQVSEQVIKKDAQDIKRLNNKYNMDIFNKNCYNLNVNTTYYDIDEVLTLIMENLELKFPELI